MESKQDHHHTAIIGHPRSGAGRLRGLASALILTGAALYAIQAQAEPFAKCDGLKLTKASGVPGGSTHNYAFEGTCWLENYVSDKKKFEGRAPAVASALWNGNSHTYTEHVRLRSGSDLQKITSSSSLFSSSTHVSKGSHVGTGAEDATFTCDKDPVINMVATCTLISRSNATGWGGQSSGFAYSAAHGEPLLARLATLTQAKRLSKHNALISCKGLHLTAASGVPNGKKRTYKFSGTCNLYHSLNGTGGLQVTHVLANGKWDAVAQQAEEGVTVLTKPNEGGGGWSTKYTCTADPWLNRHAKCSKTFQLGKTPRVYDPITDILDQHPITMGRVNTQQAAQLSEKHTESSAHAGKKSGPSLVSHAAGAESAHSNTKNLHLAPANSSSPARPGTVQARPRLKMPAPNVRKP